MNSDVLTILSGVLVVVALSPVNVKKKSLSVRKQACTARCTARSHNICLRGRCDGRRSDFILIIMHSFLLLLIDKMTNIFLCMIRRGGGAMVSKVTCPHVLRRRIRLVRLKKYVEINSTTFPIFTIMLCPMSVVCLFDNGTRL
jgi:hypothetical protein